MSNTTHTVIDANASMKEGVEDHPFGVADAKNRGVGARVWFEIITLVDAPADTGHAYRDKPAGTYFCWRGQATRGGKEYGASQPINWCSTEVERHHAVNKYLKAAEQRAKRQFVA